MSKTLLLIILMIFSVSCNLERSRRSIMTDGGKVTKECIGNLKLVTKTKTNTFTMSMARMMVKSIARVVVEGSCCATIYSGAKYKGRSHRISSPGEFFIKMRRVRSVILSSC